MGQRRRVETAGCCCRGHGLPADRGRLRKPGPGDAASAYLSAWSRGDLSAASLKTSDPTSAMHTLSRLRTDLRIDHVATHLGKVSSQAGDTSAVYTADVAIHGVGTWHYTATLPMEKVNGHWRVHWTTQDVHPQYGAGDRLMLDRTLPPRAAFWGQHRETTFRRAGSRQRRTGEATPRRALGFDHRHRGPGPARGRGGAHGRRREGIADRLRAGHHASARGLPGGEAAHLLTARHRVHDQHPAAATEHRVRASTARHGR